MDGLDNNDIVVGSVRATFSQEAVREFQVITNSYSAEFGKASGGVVNIVTKSGTNAATATRSSSSATTLNRRSTSSTFTPAGQPIDRDKAPYSQKQFGATLAVPFRTGRSSSGRSNARHLGQPLRDHRPDRGVGADQRGVSPVELGNVPLSISNNEFLGKVDYYWSPLHNLVARVNYADIEREGVDDFGGSVARSRGSVQNRTDWGVSIAQTDVLSSQRVNEFRMQYAHEDQAIPGVDPIVWRPVYRNQSRRADARSRGRRERRSSAHHAEPPALWASPGRRVHELPHGCSPREGRRRI